MPELAALILAAGAGRRFGAIKQLAPVRGEPMIRHAIALAEAVAPGAVQVVLGAHRAQIAAQLPQGVPAIEHPGWAEGLGSSLAAGMVGLRGQPDGVLLLLADQIVVMSAGRIRAQGTTHDLMSGAHDPDVAALMAMPKRQAARIAAIMERGPEAAHG